MIRAMAAPTALPYIPTGRTGPVLSPDDPRYGRPTAPPVYSDRRADRSDPVARRSPLRPARWTAAGDLFGSRHSATLALRRMTVCGRPKRSALPAPSPASVEPAAGPDGRPMTIAALPPEEQPETGSAKLAPNLRRQEVPFVTKEPAGTLVVDTPNTYLYYVLGNGRAIRYGVRVGRDGFTWTGVQKITRKTEWPDWHPPPEMIERQPYLPRFMAGGPGNPLGARAMYLGSTVYRIHGTNQPSTIGKFVSSGCIGMLNEDVSDLFDRVKVGTRVVVLSGRSAAGGDRLGAAGAGTERRPAAGAGVERSRHAADRGAAAAGAGNGALGAHGISTSPRGS